jgi:DNA-binding MltR family transcriptional regulator
MRMDLTEIEGEYEKEKIYSFLSTAWAVIADCDINSEVIRVFCKRNYAGSINF